MPEFYVPNESRVEINVPVLLFALGISVLTGIVFGLAPALQTSKPDVTDALKAARSTGGAAEGRRSRSLLVVIEVALSVVLLAGAGLDGPHVSRAAEHGLGRRPRSRAGDRRAAASRRSTTRSTSATASSRSWSSASAACRASRPSAIGLPFGGPQSPFTIAGQTPDDSKRIIVNLAAADHLRAFGIPLRGGRMFDAAEVRRGDRVAVINEAAAKLWPAGENPIGARLRLGVLERAPARTFVDTSRPPEVTIVGIVANTRNAGLRAEPTPAVIVPYTIVATLNRTLAVRTAGDPNLLLNPVRAELRAMDAEQPLGRAITLGEILGQEVIQPRFTMALFSAFAALGLALAAAGIYSVLSFHVTRRTHELGVRMALGAPRRHVLGLMLMMGGRLVLVGLVVGIAASLAATRLLRSQLFGVQATDPLAYAAVVVLLGAGDAARLLHARAARSRRRSDGGAAAGVRLVARYFSEACGGRLRRRSMDLSQPPPSG